MAAITMNGVSKAFLRRGREAGDDTILPVLDSVDLSVADREFLCLLGVSGSGKSTILNLLCGLEGNYDGTIAFNGQTVPQGQRPNFRIGYVFQEPRLLPWASVAQNVKFALRAAGIAPDEYDDRAREWIRRVGLGGFEESYPHELSGGMRQRASIARSFAIDPDVLLMDEPFSGLDEFTGRQMREELLALWRETRKTIVFVTHHCFEACFLSDRIVILGSRPGRIVAERLVDLPRPRNYEDPNLFTMSVEVSRLVQEIGGNPPFSAEDSPDSGALPNDAASVKTATDGREQRGFRRVSA